MTNSFVDKVSELIGKEQIKWKSVKNLSKAVQQCLL